MGPALAMPALARFLLLREDTCVLSVSAPALAAEGKGGLCTVLQWRCKIAAASAESPCHVYRLYEDG